MTRRRAPALPLAGLALLAAPLAAQTGAVTIPTRYAEDRWVVRPVTEAGDTLDLFTDSGGGFVFVVRERLPKGAPVTFDRRGDTGDSLWSAPWPAFRDGAGIPTPLHGPKGTVSTAPEAWFRKTIGGVTGARDGFLGNGWHAGRIWVYDYPARTLRLLPAGTPPAPLGGATVPLGFKDGEGPRFPRVRVAVDGDSLDLLLDTGASTRLTDSALAAVGDGRPASRGASFIARSVFDRWRARHPDWRVVARAESFGGADMIEVPEISVGGVAAGPVWFTARPDRNFHEWMSGMMDRRIEGALGGSGLRYYRVTVDYVNRRATFERPAR